jgi:hypothetical protein
VSLFFFPLGWKVETKQATIPEQQHKKKQKEQKNPIHHHRRLGNDKVGH